MVSSDDDEELKQAIAMSLADFRTTPTPPPPTDVIDLVSSDDDDDDDNLRQAIALSLRKGERAAEIGSAPRSLNAEEPCQRGHAIADSVAHHITPSQPQPEASLPLRGFIPPKTSSGLFGLDRRAMEQERLARLGKRKRTPSPERPGKMTMKSPLVGTANIQFKAKMSKLSVSADPKVTAKPSPKIKAIKESHRGPSADQSPIQYPKGTVKRTWAFKHPRTNDIKIEEVLQTSTLNIAVLSSFQWDERWLNSKLDTSKVKQIWIMNAKGKDLQEKLLAEATESMIPNLKPHFPPMPGQTMAMHSKLMLLFHPSHLRIVIPTANMTNVDWGETEKDPRTGESWQPAVMENSVFLIDLPRHSNGQVSEKKDVPSFGRELQQFLEAQEVGRNVIDGLLKFDFSETGHIEFVHAIGGSHSSQSGIETGLLGLSKALGRLGLDQVKDLELDYATSSLGALKDSFLKQLYIAASGELPLSDHDVPSDYLDRIRIYFPSRDTVIKSTGGPACGGIITLNRKFYGATFPKQCMREYKSTRKGVLSHNKILLARGRKKDNTPFAWAYIGSANLTESAWGAQKVLKSGKEGALTIRNWECGVVVPVSEETLKGLDLEDGEIAPMSVFEGTLEVPFQHPGEEYEGKEPWFFMN